MVGALAQLGEHLLCKQGVIGSIPISSTNRETIAVCGFCDRFYHYPSEEIKVCIISNDLMPVLSTLLREDMSGSFQVFWVLARDVRAQSQ